MWHPVTGFLVYVIAPIATVALLHWLFDRACAAAGTKMYASGLRKSWRSVGLSQRSVESSHDS